MDLNEIRKTIDGIDNQIKGLLMQRMDCSVQVAQSKREAGSTDIYRADREIAMLERLSADVPEDRKRQYVSSVRKIIETSRMYQYDLLYKWDSEVFKLVDGWELCDKPGSSVTVRLSRANRPNAMSSILSMVGDHGFNMSRMELVEETPELVTFDLVILGDVSTDLMRVLVFQLSKECESFRVLSND